MAKRDLSRAVVVITGASSGIGRAAARQFARAGARLVLAARREAELLQTAAECERVGARAIVVPTDVSDPAAVENLARRAIDELGRIDVWCNNAGVYGMGAVNDMPLEVHRRIVEVNLLGVLHGAKAALARFNRQGSGVLINTAATAGRVPYGYVATYCATKAAVRALTEALRQEQAGRDIHICAVSPATVDTPLFDHSANYTGREIRAMPPVYDVERVARAIVRCAERPRRELLVGAQPRLASLLRPLLRPLSERLTPALVQRRHLGANGAVDSPGNLFVPVGPGGASGGWKRVRPFAALAALVAAGVGAALVGRRRLLTSR
jgi:short-subunit dehydrogenase